MIDLCHSVYGSFPLSASIPVDISHPYYSPFFNDNWSPHFGTQPIFVAFS